MMLLLEPHNPDILYINVKGKEYKFLGYQKWLELQRFHSGFYNYIDKLERDNEEYYRMIREQYFILNDIEEQYEQIKQTYRFTGSKWYNI